MAKTTRNSGKSWKPSEVKQLRDLAKSNTPTRVIGLKLGRTKDAVHSKAAQEGISLKPSNQSPYSRGEVGSTPGRGSVVKDKWRDAVFTVRRAN